MRLVVAFPSGTIGGAQCDGLDLVLEFLRRHWQVAAVVGDDGPLCDRLTEAGVTVYVSHMTWWIVPPSYEYHFREVILDSMRLLALFRHFPIDLVYTISSVTPCAAIAAVSLGIPHIWHIHEVVQTWPDRHFLFPTPITRRLIEFSGAAIVANSAYTASHFPSRKTVVIPNVLRDLRQLPACCARTDGAFTIGVIGSIWPIKRQDRALPALAALRARGVDAEIVFRGAIADKEYYEALLEQGRSLHISPYVRFDGHIANPIGRENPVDVVLVTCPVETFSRAAMEAFACSVPVVAPSTGGVAEVVKDGDGGLLYDDATELVDILQRLAREPDWLQTLGRRGRARLDRWFARNVDPAGRVASLVETRIRRR